MSRNTIRQKELSEEVQEELQETVEEKAEQTEAFIKTLFTVGDLSLNRILHYLPFGAFIAFLMMLYISNRHFAERTIRSIDKVSKEVKELGWDHKSLSAELMKMSTQTEIAKRVDSLGLKELVEPPIKIEVIENKDDSCSCLLCFWAYRVACVFGVWKNGKVAVCRWTALESSSG